ncbi:enoyl-CoA hydratase [Bacillus sp. B15-48]|uniref:enoyl-CoA hydratase n=1 Tax=Bacillus sp. B15-48 TaxID=1548601 RepID=UPI00193FFC80|nr:enoyl-CoA hydratase [Bacillus sp. B15-48]MBM4763317.1 enoyl-CoA hydratase [Bacillus sp. B15-48]
MKFETILYEKKGGVAKITMNRPEVRNAQNGRMIEEMHEAYQVAEKDQEVKVVILAGAGPTFCSGHDLKTYPVEEGALFRAANTEGKWEYEKEYFYEKTLKPWRMKKPVIAQVQGHCVAAGFMLANMCDLIVAADNAQFGDPVVRMGAAAVEVFCHPWVLPPRIAKELLLTGNLLNAEQALQFGMVNKVVPLEQLEEETLAMAEHIAKMPSFAVGMIKHSINRTMDIMGFSNSLNAHFDTHILVHRTDEALTLLDANREKAGSVKQFIQSRDEQFSENSNK